MRLSKRAESQDKSKLVQTFVDVGPLLALLSRVDHQIIYGRRGTGKTHAITYLAEKRRDAGDCVIYLDLRTVGSTGGIFGDTQIPLSERATRLLADTLLVFHDGLTDFFALHSESLNFAECAPILDGFAAAAAEIGVCGTVEQQHTNKSSDEGGTSSKTSIGIGRKNSGLLFEDKDFEKSSEEKQEKLIEKGDFRHRVHFGTIVKALEKLTRILGKRRVWLLLDEWSSIPQELQPFLADLLRRCVFPVSNCTVQIAAIEQRSTFKLPSTSGDYVGIEVGADASADLNFDDFMVFEHDAARATQFFQELLFNHVSAIEGVSLGGIGDADSFIREAFTQKMVFTEFVRSAEGVPRDAMNIVSLAAQKALTVPISAHHLRTAARDWYQRDKEAAVRSNPLAHELLHWIIVQVIGSRHARAFLVRSRSDMSHSLIESLFDSRVLHILKRNISSHDQPGVRYDVFKLDYGCYVDLINTAKAPQGLLPFQNEPGEPQFTEVPPDDYRAIRRAILDLSEFEKTHR